MWVGWRSDEVQNDPEQKLELEDDLQDNFEFEHWIRNLSIIIELQESKY